MKIEKDPRINAWNVPLKGYLLLFVTLAILSSFNLWIYLIFVSTLKTNHQFAIIILLLYIMPALTTACMGKIHYALLTRPILRISEAARKVAKGNFSIRIAPLRKDKKKDFIEVMFDDFNSMVHELANIENFKDDFIANVSHEIKTPLAVIQGYTTALQNDKLDINERNDYINTIVEASQKLSELVSNILKLNKLENQEILLESNPFNLTEQLRRCVFSFEELREQKNISFDSELEEINVCHDENLLEIVWNNLLSNAIKFTNTGGSIFMKLKVQNGNAQISISDTGCGMSEETQKHVFDKFYQGDTAHSKEGNGLGLAMVKRAITLLGGTVTLESQPDQGSTFTICLKI